MTRLLDRLEAKGLLPARALDRRPPRRQPRTDAPKARSRPTEVPVVLAQVLNEHLAGFSKTEWHATEGHPAPHARPTAQAQPRHAGRCRMNDAATSNCPASPRRRRRRATMTTVDRRARRRRSCMALAGCASTARHRRRGARCVGAGGARPADRGRRGRAGRRRLVARLRRPRARRPGRPRRWPATRTCASPQARVARAAANVDVARTPPTGRRSNGALDVTRQRFTENGIYPPPLAGSIADDRHRCSSNGSWELDFFGRNRAALDAALGSERAAAGRRRRGARAARQQRRAQLLAARAPGRAARGRCSARWRSATRCSRLVRQRVAAGLDTAVELRQSEGLRCPRRASRSRRSTSRSR